MKFYQVFRNAHPNVDGTPWGWWKTMSGIDMGTWSGAEQEKAVRHHAEYGDMIYSNASGERYAEGSEICGLNACALHYPEAQR